VLSDRTVANILKRHGVEPAPQRKRRSTWAPFLKAHREVLAATDFTTVEVWTTKGLVTCYLLFVMELATRRVQCAGITTNLDEVWMKQMARNLTMADDGFLSGKRYLLMDRDSKFSAAFRQILTDAVTEPVRLPPRMREAQQRGEQLGLTDDEIAFYDALEVNDSAVKVLGDEVLKLIARDLVKAVRNNLTIDWTVRENVRANLRVIIKRILRKHGYPPDKQEKATDTVLEQAEALSRAWVEG
jgi:restriction endonuclease HindI-like protein